MGDVRYYPGGAARHAGRRRPAGARRLFNFGAALLVGTGVFLVSAGLFYYTFAAPDATPTPIPAVDVALLRTPAPHSPSPLSTSTPSGSKSHVQTPSPSPTPAPAVATRIVIPALGIDLPVVAPRVNETLPLCNAAEYLVIGGPLAYPGLPQATYLYAHARAGMFGPLLTQSQKNNGAAMIGMQVEVYTADNQNHVYQITKVIRHIMGSASLSAAADATTDQLWLQTSEGPYDSSPKMQVVAAPVGVMAASYADSHPTRQGSVCPY
jgi:sortase (surface protein transpeptidase)